LDAKTKNQGKRLAPEEEQKEREKREEEKKNEREKRKEERIKKLLLDKFDD